MRYSVERLYPSVVCFSVIVDETCRAWKHIACQSYITLFNTFTDTKVPVLFAPSSQVIIHYFTVEERERERKKNSLPASDRVMFLTHTNSSLSCCAIYLSYCHEGCFLQGTEHSSLRGQAYIHTCSHGDT